MDEKINLGIQWRCSDSAARMDIEASGQEPWPRTFLIHSICFASISQLPWPCLDVPWAICYLDGHPDSARNRNTFLFPFSFCQEYMQGLLKTCLKEALINSALEKFCPYPMVIKRN